MSNKEKCRSEVFRQTVLDARTVRAHLDRFLVSVEQQRLQAWATWQSDPEGKNDNDMRLEDVYRIMTRQQQRLQAAVMRWKAENPEPLEDEEEDGEVIDGHEDTSPEAVEDA